MLGQFVHFAGENSLDMYFNGEICREGEFAGLLLNKGWLSELTGGISGAQVPASLNSSYWVNFNGEISKKQGS